MLNAPVSLHEMNRLIRRAAEEKTWLAERDYYAARLQNENFYIRENSVAACPAFAEHTRVMLAECEEKIREGRGDEKIQSGWYLTRH